jgi:hypothetical protein
MLCVLFQSHEHIKKKSNKNKEVLLDIPCFQLYHHLAEEALGVDYHLADEALGMDHQLAYEVLAVDHHLADEALEMDHQLADDALGVEHQLALALGSFVVNSDQQLIELEHRHH